MRVETIVGVILARDHHRAVRMEYLLRFIALVCVLILISMTVNYSLATRGPLYRYLLIESSGQLMQRVPLERANMTDEELMRWGVDAVTRVYSFDFVNYQRHFQNAQNTILTQAGWGSFQRALSESGNFNAILKNRWVTTAAPTAPARILNQGLMEQGGQSRYAWVIEFPMLLTYRSGRVGGTTSQNLTVQVTLVRMPENVFRSGVGIRQIIAR